MVTSFLPLIGIAVFAAIVFCWRPWLQFRRYGSSGILLFRSGNRRQDLRDSLAVLLFVLLLGQAIVAAARPQSLSPQPDLPRHTRYPDGLHAAASHPAFARPAAWRLCRDTAANLRGRSISAAHLW